MDAGGPTGPADVMSERFAFTGAEYQRFVWVLYSRTPRGRRTLGIFLLMVLILLAASLIRPAILWYAAGVGMLLAVAVLLLIAPRFTARNPKTNPERQVFFGNTGFGTVTDVGETRFEWPALTDIVRTGDLTVLLVGSSAVGFPDDAVPRAGHDILEALVAATDD